MKRSKRYTEAERKDFISQFHQSHLCASAFCRAQGISTVSLALWRKRYTAKTPRSARARPATDCAAPAWVPVLVRDDGPSPPPAAAAAAAACYALVAHTGRLEVPRGFDAREVAALWRVLSPGSLMEMGVAS